MNLRKLILALLFIIPQLGFSQGQDMTPRLRRAYVLLAQADAIASGGTAASKQQMETFAQSLPADRLKEECNKLTGKLDKAISDGPKKLSIEVFAYVKNALMRIRYDREESPDGHVKWAAAHKDEARPSVRKQLDEIKTLLK